LSEIDNQASNIISEQNQLLDLSKSLLNLAASLESFEKRYFLDLRLEDHRNWVKTLKGAVESKNPNIQLALDHTLCKFGKWYFNYTPTPEEQYIFHKIDKPHQLIHATGREVLNELRKGDYKKAESIFENEILKLMHEIEELFAKYKLSLIK